MTNYEKIKAMSVEEMADYIFDDEEQYSLAPCDKKYCSVYTDGYKCKYVGKSECRQATKNWLESEEVQNDKS